MAPVAPARAMNLKQASTSVTWINGLAMDTRKNMSYWLVVEPPTPLKIYECQLGWMTFPTDWRNKNMFQTTNQKKKMIISLIHGNFGAVVWHQKSVTLKSNKTHHTTRA